MTSITTITLITYHALSLPGFEAVGRNSSFLAIVGPFNNTQRSYCLQLSATADSILQSNRILILSASLRGAAQPSLVISPNITTVTIIDNTGEHRQECFLLVDLCNLVVLVIGDLCTLQCLLLVTFVPCSACYW